MLKTYLYIPDNLNEKINRTALRQKKSKAEVIRQALERGIKETDRENNQSGQIFLKLSHLGKKYKLKGPKNSSTRIDELLWNKDWNEK